MWGDSRFKYVKFQAKSDQYKRNDEMQYTIRELYSTEGKNI